MLSTANNEELTLKKLTEDAPEKLDDIQFDPVVKDSSDDSQEEVYEYPFPDDNDAEFRKKCKDSFNLILTYC